MNSFSFSSTWICDVFQDFDYTRQREIRHSYVKELCLQPEGTSLVTRSCKYPNTEVPIEQKWELKGVSMKFNHIKKICFKRVRYITTCFMWKFANLILLYQVTIQDQKYLDECKLLMLQYIYISNSNRLVK